MLTGAIEAPKRIEDLHVRRDLVASLLLRTLAFSDQLSGAALETRLGLPFETLQPLIEEFQKTQLMDTLGFSNEPAVEGRPIPVRMNYTVSSAGRQRAAEMSSVQTRYLGPCPVNFEDYLVAGPLAGHRQSQRHRLRAEEGAGHARARAARHRPDRRRHGVTRLAVHLRRPGQRQEHHHRAHGAAHGRADRDPPRGLGRRRDHPRHRPRLSQDRRGRAADRPAPGQGRAAGGGRRR